jgi:hypothetical protein
LEAEKSKLTNREVLRVLGEPDDDPKTGPYTAVCVSRELGEILVELMAAGENIKPTAFTKGSAQNLMNALPIDTSEVKFHLWRFHDFRRCHITLVGLQWGEFWDVAQVHGHASVSTMQKYYQWGLAQRRKARGTAFRLNI